MTDVSTQRILPSGLEAAGSITLVITIIPR
jgi:hypothetical protein